MRKRFSTVFSSVTLIFCALAAAQAQAALLIKNEATASIVGAGERIRFAASVSNTNTTAQTVTLTATVPANTSVAKSELSLAAYCDGVSAYTTCNAGQVLQFLAFSVPAGATTIVIYPALVSTTSLPAAGAALKSTATAKAGTTTVTSQASSIYSASASKLLHVTSSTLPAQARAGGTLIYTLRYANPGSAAVDANLTFAVPTGLSFVAASDGGVSASGTVTWALGSVAIGGSGVRTLTLKGSSTLSAGTLIVSDAVLRDPTTQAVIADTKLATSVGNSNVTSFNISAGATTSFVQAGERIRYSVTIANTAAAAHTAYVQATIPAHTSVAKSELSVAAYCDGVAAYTTCAAGQTLEFLAVSVPAGGSVSVVYPALVSTTSPPGNGALLNSDLWVQDASIANQYQTRTAAVANSSASKQVRVTSNALPAQTLPGGSLIYTLTYGNPGSAGVAADLSFNVPEGLSFVSASDGGTDTAGIVTWSLGTLAAGSSGARTVTLKTASTAVAGSLVVTDAALRDPTTQALLGDAQFAASVSSANQDTLNVSAAANAKFAAAGQNVRYTVTISNNAAAAHTVYVQSIVPANTSVTKAELSLAAYCDGVAAYTTCTAGQTLEFLAVSVPAAGTVTLVYPALVSTTSPPPNGRLLNSDVWVQDASLGNHYLSNAAAVAASGAAKQLALSSNALPAQVLPGGSIIYTLQYGNPGSAGVAANLTFNVPAGTSFVSASDGGTQASGTVTWSLGTVGAAASGKRTVTLKSSSTTLPGSQVVTYASLLNPTSKALLAQAKLAIGVGSSSASALNVSATATASSAAAGQYVRYAVTVSNTAAAAHTVYVQATVPPNTSVAKAEQSVAAYCDGVAAYTTCAAGQTLEFLAVSVPAAGSVTLVYPALVSTTSPPTSGRLLNSDVWVQDASISDHYLVNVASVAASGAAKLLELTSSAAPAQVLAGGSIVYTLTYGNPGTAGVAANLTFNVPSGTSFVSASNSGTNTGGVVTWSLGTVAAGASGKRTVTLKAASTALPGSLVVTTASLRNPTSQALIADAKLATDVGNATITSLKVALSSSPATAGPGQRVTFAVKVSNVAAAAHTVYVQATVPAHAKVTKTELSLAAYCDGVAAYTYCNGGQTLEFLAASVAAAGSTTITYPAILSVTTPATTGTLINSDVWVNDASQSNHYVANAASVASSTVVPALGSLQETSPGGMSVNAVSMALTRSSSSARTGVAAGKAAVQSAAAVKSSATKSSAINSPKAAAAQITSHAHAILVLDRDALETNPQHPSDARWPAYLAQRLASETATPTELTVVHDTQGASLLLRAAPAGAKYVVFLDGIAESDARAGAAPLTTAQIIARHRQLISRAHAQGLKIYGATLPPFEGTAFPAPLALGEATRTALNAWIRSSAAYDGVMDFDLAVSDPKHPTRLLALYDSGDHLHLNDAGDEALAEAVDLSLFVE